MLNLERISPRYLERHEQHEYYTDIEVSILSSSTSQVHYGLITNKILPNRIKDTFVVQENTLCLKYYKGLGFEYCNTQEAMYLAHPTPVFLHRTRAALARLENKHLSLIRNKRMYYCSVAFMETPTDHLTLILVHKDLVTYLPTLI